MLTQWMFYEVAKFEEGNDRHHLHSEENPELFTCMQIPSFREKLEWDRYIVPSLCCHGDLGYITML